MEELCITFWSSTVRKQKKTFRKIKGLSGKKNLKPFLSWFEFKFLSNTIPIVFFLPDLLSQKKVPWFDFHRKLAKIWEIPLKEGKLREEGKRAFSFTGVHRSPGKKSSTTKCSTYGVKWNSTGVSKMKNLIFQYQFQYLVVPRISQEMKAQKKSKIAYERWYLQRCSSKKKTSGERKPWLFLKQVLTSTSPVTKLHAQTTFLSTDQVWAVSLVSALPYAFFTRLNYVDRRVFETTNQSTRLISSPPPSFIREIDVCLCTFFFLVCVCPRAGPWAPETFCPSPPSAPSSTRTSTRRWVLHCQCSK